MQVDLKSSDLWRVPDFVTQPRVILCITEIDLSYNSIFYLKDLDLSKFGQIRSLNLSSNSVLRIPSAISAMKSLHSLDISHNNLRSLPLSMRECILLTTLKLGGNKISDFPKVLLKMNLIELEIGYNYLKALPLEIESLQSLSVFICCNNMLGALPPTFPELRKIKVLDFRHNLIQSFSLEIFRLPCITVLTLWGNPCPYVQSIESGLLQDIPEEWRVALPQLLAAGNPPKKQAEAKSTKSSKQSSWYSCFFKRIATHPLPQKEAGSHVTPNFSTDDAIRVLQQNAEIPVPLVAEK